MHHAMIHDRGAIAGRLDVQVQVFGLSLSPSWFSPAPLCGSSSSLCSSVQFPVPMPYIPPRLVQAMFGLHKVGKRWGLWLRPSWFGAFELGMIDDA